MALLNFQSYLKSYRLTPANTSKVRFDITGNWTAARLALFLSSLSRIYAFEVFWELLAEVDSDGNGELLLEDVGLFRRLGMPTPGGRSLDAAPIERPRLERQVPLWEELLPDETHLHPERYPLWQRIREHDAPPRLSLEPGFKLAQYRFALETSDLTPLETFAHYLETKGLDLACQEVVFHSPGRVVLRLARKVATRFVASLATVPDGQSVELDNDLKRAQLHNLILQNTERRLELIDRYGQVAFQEAHIQEVEELARKSFERIAAEERLVRMRIVADPDEEKRGT